MSRKIVRHTEIGHLIRNRIIRNRTGCTPFRQASYAPENSSSCIPYRVNIRLSQMSLFSGTSHSHTPKAAESAARVSRSFNSKIFSSEILMELSLLFSCTLIRYETPTLKRVPASNNRYDCVRFDSLVKRLSPAPPSALDNLTLQQANFSKAVASGKSPTAAAFDTYDCTTRDSAKQIGKKLMAQDDIRASVEELMNGCGLTRGYRVRKLLSHCENADAGLSLKALDISFKISGDYAPFQVEIIEDWQIRALIASLPPNTIEVEAEEVQACTTIVQNV